MRAFIIGSAALVMAAGLSGCAAYEVASTAAHVTTTIVSTTADVAGAIISAPFGGSDDSGKKSKGD